MTQPEATIRQPEETKTQPEETMIQPEETKTQPEETMTQAERRSYLIHALLQEKILPGAPDVPESGKEQEDLLRSLMNVRPPKPVSEEFLRIQDAYLTTCLEQEGVTDGMALPAVPSDERLALWQGDITLLAADAIVNAANAQMLGCFQPLHNCIDNVIHTRAGIRLRLACDAQMRKIREKLGESYMQPTGIPMMTDAFNLPAKKVIHVVGPIVEGTLTDEHREQLAMCYRNVLMLAARAQLTSVAFCCISTGVFMFPRQEAAEIAVSTVRAYLDRYPGIRRVIFNVFQDEDYAVYDALLDGT